MLTGITTRTSTPQEDTELWPGGSARPFLAYLTGTLGMTETDARELLKAARTAQAETGPGTLVGYPVPGGDAPADPLRARQPCLPLQAHKPGGLGTTGRGGAARAGGDHGDDLAQRRLR